MVKRDTSQLRSTIAALSAEVSYLKNHQKHREKIWKHRVAKLESQLKDRHKRIDKLMEVASESLTAVEDTDYVKKLSKRIEELESQLTESDECLRRVAGWIENWDVPFTDDPEWLEYDAPRINAVLHREKGDE